jgi:arylsulfatase A-like enzyme
VFGLFLYFFIPFSFFGFCRSKLRSILEEMAIASQCALIASCLPLPLQPLFIGGILLYMAADFLFAQSTGARLRPNLFMLLKNLSSFRHSIPRRPVIYFFLFSIALVLSLMWIPRVDALKSGELLFVIPAIVPLFLPSLGEEKSNLFFLFERDFYQKKTIGKSSGSSLLRPGLFEGPARFQIDLKRKEKPHILFLFLESFRAKNVGCLGSKTPLTPGFDAWAKKGILFSSFQSNGLLTSMATIASLFGVLPAFVTSYFRYYLSIPLKGLPEILNENGYQNGLILGGQLDFQGWREFFEKHRFQMMMGKREIQSAIPSAEATSWGVHDEWIYQSAHSWLKEQTKPSFLCLYSNTAHHPWIVPAHWQGPSFEHVSETERPYCKAISYADWTLDRFLQSLDEEKLLDKSLLFIFGDHGQSLGERDAKIILNRTLYQENIHGAHSHFLGRKKIHHRDTENKEIAQR